VAFDPEWNPETDEWYEAGFTDTQRSRTVLHIADFFGNEKALIQATVDKLNSYKGGIVLGWWSRGKLKFGKHYSNNKKRRKRGDLSRLHEKCIQYGIESPVSLISRYDAWPTLFDTTTIDLHSIFDLPLVRDTLFQRAYQSTKLGEVYISLYPEDPLGSKLEGVIDGGEVATTFSGNVVVQRAYVQRDADMTLRLAEAREGQLLGAFLEIAKEIDLSFEEVCHSSLTKWWKRIFDNMGYTNSSKDPATGEPYFWKAANPNEKAFAGGLNLELKEGLYYNLRVLDVSSLYPFMVMLFNISFDRICCNCCKDDPAAQVPKEVLVDADDNPLPGRNYWICQKQGDGVFAVKMREFWMKRAEYKQLWKKAMSEGNFDLAKIYEVKQLAYKVLMNGGFGCFGNEYFHYRDMRVSELITAYGRYTLKQLCAMAIKKYGFEIASGDTDSIFILNKGPDNNDVIRQFIEECAQHFKSRKKGDDLKLILEDDRTYMKILLAAHKNYVGLTTKSLNRPDIKGMTGNKRSMPLWGREVFNGVVQDFFGKPDVIEDPRPRIKQAIEELEAGMVPLHKLKKWERLDMDPADYKNEKDPKRIFGLRDELQEDDKIWYYLADKTKTDVKVSFTENPAEINLQKYKEYLETAIEPFLKALGDSDDIRALLGLPLKKKKKQHQQHQEPEEGSKELDN
jgi:DNA polymerase I